MKLRREEEEGKIAFAVRVVNTHGGFITPAEAFELVDRRSYKGLTKAKIGAQLSIAWRQNKLDKRRVPRTPDMKGQTPVAYGPIAPKQAELKELMAADAIEAAVQKPQRPKRASVNDVPYGELLAFTGKSRDDIMSVIEDWLYDTPLVELKQKHPHLYEAVNKLV
tara:strand:+ start:1258 stop:1752 length:495 start_codon:yes stop_codon:yes gene_type:complete